MVRDDLHTTIPSYFRCPISLDVMKSPVSLCTGVTYDRASIQRWLDSGNNTCPATMQVLQTKDLVPNHTLQRLIEIWLGSARPQTQPNSPPIAQLTKDQARNLVHILKADLQNFDRAYDFLQVQRVIKNLSRLVRFANESEENGKFLASSAGAGILPVLILNLDDKKVVKDFILFEKLVHFCNVILQHHRTKSDPEAEPNSRIGVIGSDFKSSVLMGLKQSGKPELRFAIAKLLDLMTCSDSYPQLKDSLADDDEIYSELLTLTDLQVTSSDCNQEAVESALSSLINLALPKRNRVKIIHANGVKILAKTLSSEQELATPVTEKVLKLMEMVSACKEGRAQICSDEACLQAIAKKVLKLKVSSMATEHAVTILWSLCCLFGDKKAQESVSKSNGIMAKILLLMQSNCSPAVRQMAGDLLKVFRYSSKSSCNLTCYDTRTTHIMPF